MNKIVAKLPLIFGFVFCVWVGIQICLLFMYWEMPNHDDALFYQRLAQECVDKGTWYPGVHSELDPFIFGPGYINLLVLLHHLFGSFQEVRLLNLLLNVLMVVEVGILARRLFDEKTGYMAAILYMLTFSNVYLPIAMLTDLPFTFLLLTALLLCTGRKTVPIVIAGVLIAIANWFRPLALVFLLTILTYFIVNKKTWRQYTALVLPLLLTVFLIGQSAKARTGHFVYQAVSGGYNLAMSSFDDANGLVNFNGFGDSTNYIFMKRPITYTYMERDSFLKEASLKWIIENPVQYVAQVPFKLVALYCEDTWTERVKPDMGFRVVLSKAKGDKLALAKVGVALVLKSVVYYFILFFFVYYLWTERRSLFSRRNIFLLIPFLGTAVTVVFVITSRYHYPYLFVITIYAAAGIWTYFAKDHTSKRIIL